VPRRRKLLGSKVAYSLCWLVRNVFVLGFGLLKFDYVVVGRHGLIIRRRKDTYYVMVISSITVCSAWQEVYANKEVALLAPDSLLSADLPSL
jgi:hypothetical protein